MSQKTIIEIYSGDPFRVMFPKIGYHRVPPGCAMKLGFYGLQYQMKRIAIPEMIDSGIELAGAVMRLSSMAYGATP